jgi:hypothetical protein
MQTVLLRASDVARNVDSIHIDVVEEHSDDFVHWKRGEQIKPEPAAHVSFPDQSDVQNRYISFFVACSEVADYFEREPNVGNYGDPKSNVWVNRIWADHGVDALEFRKRDEHRDRVDVQKKNKRFFGISLNSL